MFLLKHYYFYYFYLFFYFCKTKKTVFEGNFIKNKAETI